MTEDLYLYGEWSGVPVLCIDTWNGKYNCAIHTQLLGGFLEIIVALKENKEFMFVSRKSMRQMADLAHQKLIKDPRYFHKVVERYKKGRPSHIARMEEISALGFSKLTNEQLRKLFHETREHIAYFGAHDWLCFSFDPLILDVVGLRSYIEKHPEQSNEIIELSQPPAILPTLDEEITVMALAVKAKGLTESQIRKKYDKELAQISKKFGWIAGFILYAPRSPEEYAKKVFELTKEKGLEQKLHEKQLFVQHGEEQMRNYIAIHNPPKEVIHAIEAVQQLSLCRALGDADSIWGFSRSRTLDAEIQRRLNLSFQSYWDLRMDEVEALLKGEKILNVEHRKSIEVMKRDAIGDLVPQQNPMQLFEKLMKHHKAVHELKGMVAFPGHVEGKVRKVESSQDVATFKQGDILVAKSTCADYVVIMSKAKAIVTEYGGITSHAAVVSRELKVPCIVGVSGLNDALEDGDLVEVDAEHGIIRKTEQ